MQKLFKLFIFSILIYGCTTPKSALDNESNGKEQLPANFNSKPGILLIEQSIDDDKSTVSVSATNSFQTDNYMNAYMKKNKNNMVEYADKNCKYKHEFASQKDIYGSMSKYSDKNIYRYALVTSLVKPSQHYNVNTSNGQLQSTHYQPIFKFYLYDRLSDKTYAALGNGSSLIMWAYKSAIKKINGDK